MKFFTNGSINSSTFVFNWDILVLVHSPGKYWHSNPHLFRLCHYVVLSLTNSSFTSINFSFQTPQFMFECITTIGVWLSGSLLPPCPTMHLWDIVPKTKLWFLPLQKVTCKVPPHLINAVFFILSNSLHPSHSSVLPHPPPFSPSMCLSSVGQVSMDRYIFPESFSKNNILWFC